MTVAELIEKLQALDSALLVVGRGYEDGYDDVGVHTETIVDAQGPGEKQSWWSGRYDDANYREGESITAVVIS